MSRRLLFVAVLALTAGAQANAHSWYPWSCCSDEDCKMVSANQLQRTTTGWLVVDSGEVVEDGDPRIKPFPDEAPFDERVAGHVCISHETHKVICLYVAEGGT